MNSPVVAVALLLLAAFLVGGGVGRVLRRIGSASPPEPPAPAPADPPLLAAPREGTGDDLKKIKGIGPKLESMLKENGVFHYDQIARWTQADIARLDEQLSLRGRIARQDWIGQAKALSAPPPSPPPSP